MRSLGRSFLAVTIALAPLTASAAPPFAAAPETVTDAYFATSVVDCYRWMERGPAEPRFVPYVKALITKGTFQDTL